MDKVTKTHADSTYEITFKFKTMAEMNKFTQEYDVWRDTMDRRKRIALLKDNNTLRYKKSHPELTLAECMNHLYKV